MKKLVFRLYLSMICFSVFAETSPTIFLVKNEISSSTHFDTKYTDSLKTALAKAVYEENVIQEIKLRRYLGIFYSEKGNINDALEYLIGAKNLCEHYGYIYEKALTYEKLANVYMLIFEHEKHYKLINEAIQIFENKKDTLSLARAYNNLASGEKFRDKENTISYLNKAMSYALTLDNDLIIAEIKINYGTLYIREQQYDSAIYFLKQALPIVKKENAVSKICETLIKLGRSYRYLNDNHLSTFYLNEAYETSLSYDNYFYIGRSLYYLATIEFDNQHNTTALSYMHKALKYQELTSDIKMKLETFKFLSSFYVTENKIDSAFYYNQLAFNLQDTINKRQNLAEIKNIEWSYKLKGKIQVITSLKEKQMVLEQKQQAEQKAKIWFWIALIILLTLCFSLFFFFKNRISLLKNKRQLLQLKSEKQKIELEQKNKELVAHTMQIYSKSNTIIEIKKNVETLKNKYVNSQEPELIKDIQQLYFMLDNNIRLDEEWEKLKIRFQQIHRGFYEKLKAKHKELTQYDLKICTFIYLGFDTKQIAQILNIDYTSLRTQRYRMRKKMHLKTEENLEEYIRKTISN